MSDVTLIRSFVDAILLFSNKSSIRGILRISFTWFIPALICFVVFNSVFTNYNIESLLTFAFENFDGVNLFYWFFVVVLIPINWGLEARKWQIVVNTKEDLNLLSSFKSVLAGLSLNMITPFGTGDAIGRLYSLNGRARLENIGGVMVVRITQLFFTLLFGSVSIIYVIYTKDSQLIALAIAIPLFVVGILLILFFRESLLNLLGVSFLKKCTVYLESVRKINADKLIELFGLSVFRYAIFTAQFYLTFLIFGIQGEPLVIVMGICWIFLIKSILPALSIFSDLASREISAIFYFTSFGIGVPEVVSATFVIWLVNIVLPSLFGVLFLPNIKILRN